MPERVSIMTYGSMLYITMAKYSPNAKCVSAAKKEIDGSHTRQHRHSAYSSQNAMHIESLWEILILSFTSHIQISSNEWSLVVVMNTQVEDDSRFWKIRRFSNEYGENGKSLYACWYICRPRS